MRKFIRITTMLFIAGLFISISACTVLVTEKTTRKPGHHWGWFNYNQHDNGKHKGQYKHYDKDEHNDKNEHREGDNHKNDGKKGNGNSNKHK